MAVPRCIVPVVLIGSTVLACGPAEKDTTAPVLQQAARSDAQTIQLTFSEAMVVGQADPAAFRLSLGVKDAGSTVYYALAYDGLGYDSDGPISDGDPSVGSGNTDTNATGGASDSGGSDTYDPTYTTQATYGEAGPTDDGYQDGGYEGGAYASPSSPGSLALPIPSRFVSDLGITGVRVVEGDAKQIELTLAGALGDSVACDALPELLADSGKAGIFVHHRAGTGSPTDAAGNAMPDLGAHWVTAIDKAYVEVPGDFPNLDPYLPIACP
jgi:hypothetical protein